MLRALERAAKANDVRSFMAATETVNWEMCQPGDFIQAVDLALNVGAFAVARDISEKGRRKYPNHPELRKHASILAPPKILRTNYLLMQRLRRTKGGSKNVVMNSGGAG